MKKMKPGSMKFRPNDLVFRDASNSVTIYTSVSGLTTRAVLAISEAYLF